VTILASRLGGFRQSGWPCCAHTKALGLDDARRSRKIAEWAGLEKKKKKEIDWGKSNLRAWIALDVRSGLGHP